MKNTKTDSARSGRWSLTKRGSGALLRYRPPKSDEELTFELNRDQLAKARKAASRGNAGEVRDIILTQDVREQALTASGISSVVAANTWRWSLPLFGGPAPEVRGGPDKSRPKRPKPLPPPARPARRR